VAAIANSSKSGEILGESITSEGGDFITDYSHIGIIAHIMKLLVGKVLNLEEQLENYTDQNSLHTLEFENK
jgi:hypothetical protein